MNKGILILLTIIPTILYGQEIKKVTDNSKNEIFYVLKSDKSTKHGKYMKFSIYDNLIIKGFYKQGVRDSIWEFFDLNRELSLKYDFTKNELVYFVTNDYLKNKKFKILNDSNIFYTTLSRPPIYLNGDGFTTSEILGNFRSPKNAVNNKVSGVVNVLFTVDKYGTASNYHVETPLGFGIDEEAIRVVKNLPNKWLPALLNGQPVDVEVVYPIVVKIR